MQTTDRDKFHKLAPTGSSYLPLRKGTKVAAAKGEETKTPPVEGGYGVIPGPRTLVLDFDGSSTTVQVGMERMSEKFGLSFENTLTTATPSGGRHIWLTFPEGYPLPDASKLSELCLGVKGDVRSARRYGYVVAPGSVVAGRMYSLAVESPAMEVSIEQAQAMYKACPNKSNKYRIEEESQKAPLIRNAKTNPETVEKLRQLLSFRKYRSWHQKRAAVWAALSCCYDNNTIASYWKELDICRDTASGNKHLRATAIRHDMKRLRRSTTHGIYCPRGHTNIEPNSLGLVKRERPTVKPEEVAELLHKKTRQSTNWRDPRVVNLDKVYDKLSSTRSSDRYVTVAFAIMETIVQPWMNFGTSNVLLGNVFVSQFLEATDLEVTKAKRLLVKQGILTVAHKQFPGKTSAFKVTPSFIHTGLSKLLKAQVLGHRRTVNIDWRNGFFHDPATGEILLDVHRPVSDSFPEMLTDGTVSTHILQNIPENFWDNKVYESYPFVEQKKEIVVSRNYVPEFWQDMMSAPHKKSHPATFAAIEDTVGRIMAMDKSDIANASDDGYTPAVRCSREHLTFLVDGDEFGMFRFDPETGSFWNVGETKPTWDADTYLTWLLENEASLHSTCVNYWNKLGIIPVTNEQFHNEYGEIAQTELVEALHGNDYNEWDSARDKVWTHDTTVHADGTECLHSDIVELRKEFYLPDYRHFVTEPVKTKKVPKSKKEDSEVVQPTGLF